MEDQYSTNIMFDYQQVACGMKFSIDQLDEQIKSIDNRLESSWLELKIVCENVSGEKFNGTLEAIDQIFDSKILENSVCCASTDDSVTTICQELINSINQNPENTNDIFDELLKVQFKEGLNFPICFKNSDGFGHFLRKSLFHENQHFNELCTILQKHFLDQLLRYEKRGLDLFSSSENEESKSNIYSVSCCYANLCVERRIEDKQKVFQRLCLLSSTEHGLVLYVNSKSILIKNEMEKFKSNSKEFIKFGKLLLSFTEEEVKFLRLCVGEEDVINFISTVYINPMMAVLESLAERLTFKTCEQPKNGKQSESVSGPLRADAHSYGVSFLQNGDVLYLLELFDWLIEADEALVKIQDSSLRCMVEQERSMAGRGNEKHTELKSALKNSNPGKAKHSEQPILTSVFSWKSILDKFSLTLMQSLESTLKECCGNSNSFVTTSFSSFLQRGHSKCPFASKNSIEIVENIERYRSFMKFVSSSNKDLFEKLQKILFDSLSENVDIVSKKIDKDIAIESLIVVLSGTDFLEGYLTDLTAYLQILNSSIIDLLQSTNKDLLELVIFKFISIITASIWPHKLNDGDDIGTEEEKDPYYWIQNWWLQMEWLWSALVVRCSFHLTSRIVLNCLGESLRSFAWHFASRRLRKQEVTKFTAGVLSLLDRSLDLLFRCCSRSEEIIDVCSNDGVIYEVHVSCVALTTTLLLSAMPLPTLKEMYNQFSTLSKHPDQPNAAISRDCQWFHVVKKHWKHFGKKRIDQLEVDLSCEILFSLWEHCPFGKQHLLLQMLLLHECHFSAKILELLIRHEVSSVRDVEKDPVNIGDTSNGDVAMEGAGVTHVINALLSVVFLYQLDEEPAFVHILEQVSQRIQEDALFNWNSTLFRFLCSSLEPVLLSVLQQSLSEIELSLKPSPQVSDVSYFFQDRLFCGCKPSSVEPRRNVDGEELVNQLKTFTSRLTMNFHRLPFSVSRFCFKFDASKTDSSNGRSEKPLIIKILVVALGRVMKKINVLNVFTESQLSVMSSITDKFCDLLSSSPLPEEYCWFKEDFTDKFCNFSKNILNAGRDENDPGLGTPRSHLSSLVFETFLRSMHSNGLAKRSLDILTSFIGSNFCQLKSVFSNEDGEKLNKETGTVFPFDFSFLCKADVHFTKGVTFAGYNPLTAREVVELKNADDPSVDWSLYSKLDLGLTEVNLPNLLTNRPEFREDFNSNLDNSSKEFLDQLKQKHLKDPN